MKPSAYASYKPSGVEWLGYIPSHWQPKRLRFLLTQKLQYGANEAAELDDPELPRYVRITDIDEQGTLREETFRSLPVEIAKPYLLKDGDILFARSGATSGKTFLYRNSWGTCAYAGYLIRARLNQGKMLPSFLRYFTASANYWQWLSSSTIQATIQNVSAEKYADLWLTYPPIAEQQTIADFLDAQTVKIDTLLAKKRQFIEKLKEKRSALIARTVTRGLPPDAAQAAGLGPHPAMKDSGVEWVGIIPTHWQTPPLYARYSIELGKMLNESRITGDYLVSYLRNIDVQWDAINFDDLPEMDIAEAEYSRYTITKDDLLVCEGGEVGRAAMVGQIDGVVGYQKALHRMRALSNEDPRFMYYTLYWAATTGVFNAGGMSTIAHLTGEQLRKYRFPKPPVQEQQAIAAYLDRETARIDQLTAKVEAALSRLTEYRQALITAAVTGKIDVRNNERIKEAA